MELPYICLTFPQDPKGFFPEGNKYCCSLYKGVMEPGIKDPCTRFSKKNCKNVKISLAAVKNA